MCTEQPGTPWFGLTLDVCPAAASPRIDINAHGVDALRTAGVDARRLQLGAVPSMIAAEPPTQPRRRRRAVPGRPRRPPRRRARRTSRRASCAIVARCACSRSIGPSAPATPGLVFGSREVPRCSPARRCCSNIHRGRPDGGRRARRTSSGRGWSRRWPTAAWSSPSRPTAPRRWSPATHFVEADRRRARRRARRAARPTTAAAPRIADAAFSRGDGRRSRLRARRRSDARPHRARRAPATGRARRPWHPPLAGDVAPRGDARVPPPVRLRGVHAAPRRAGVRRSALAMAESADAAPARRASVPAAPRRRAARRTGRDAGVRARPRPEVSVDRLAVQLRRRGHRDAGQHRRQRGRRASRWSSSTTTPPTAAATVVARVPRRAPRRADAAARQGRQRGPRRGPQHRASQRPGPNW